MDKNEVIWRLKEHLRYREKENGELNLKDWYFCITYIMDFLLLTKAEAKQFIKENIPAVANLK